MTDSKTNQIYYDVQELLKEINYMRKEIDQLKYTLSEVNNKCSYIEKNLK